MGNFIQITDKLAIASDSKQWKLQELVERKGVPQFESFAYFPTLERCVTGLGQYMLRDSHAKTYTELVHAASEISLLLSQKFTASAEVKIK